VASRRRRIAALRAALGALLLVGCAAGGPLEAPSGPVASGATVAGLPAARWGPEDPAALILAVHGFGDHGESTFARAAGRWAGRGIATVAIDQRGFGRTASHGLWPGADGLVADLRAAAADLRARHPCTPLAVVGHSMGGGVALAAAPGMPADGLVLAAPAIWGGDALNPLHRAAAWLAALVAPDRRFTGRGIVRIQPSDNIEMLRALGRDPLHHGPPSAREMMGLVRVTDRAAAAAPETRLPVLLLLGEKDQIVPNARVAEVAARIPGPVETIRYEDGWHMLFRDLQAARVWEDVGDWALGLRGPACATADMPPAPPGSARQGASPAAAPRSEG